MDQWCSFREVYFPTFECERMARDFVYEVKSSEDKSLSGREVIVWEVNFLMGPVL